ncbi:MAG: SDR family NAD(P)-dependent oxidoreductase, partial [Christensenellaceae bacterium]|nr:SDR family NAD(P)-dependent oxidoreductase [Christensenellaceae bacterium]
MKKNILLTGACGGMGRATCQKLIEEGYAVWGLDIGGKPAEGTRFIATDLTDETAVLAAFETVRRQAGELYSIVHMAGIYDLNSLVEMSEADFSRIFQVNLFAAYRVNRIFMPLLKKGSRIVLTSSELAPLDPLPFTGIYGITKTALEKYAFSLRMELSLLGIDVVVLRPGAVNTGLLGDSTRALSAICQNTALFATNAPRVRRIVDSVEAQNNPP